MAKTAKGWGAIADQTARLAEEGRQIGKPKTSKTYDSIALKPHDATVPSTTTAEPLVGTKVEKRSTSLYLSGAASRAIKKLAAEHGIRPHRVFEEALAEYLAKEENGGLDFHMLNAKA